MSAAERRSAASAKAPVPLPAHVDTTQPVGDALGVALGVAGDVADAVGLGVAERDEPPYVGVTDGVGDALTGQVKERTRL